MRSLPLRCLYPDCGDELLIGTDYRGHGSVEHRVMPSPGRTGVVFGRSRAGSLT